MKRLLLLLLVPIISCTSDQQLTPIERAMRSAHPSILQVAHDPDSYEVQVIFTQIDTDSTGKIQFTDYEFRVDDNAYFYPASTVKLPMAVVALEHVSNSYEEINANTPYTIPRDSLTHTIEDDVRQIFAISDNEAYNRLYELLGRDYVNARLNSLQLGPVRLAHRLSTPNANVPERDSLLFHSQSDTLKVGGAADGAIEVLPLSRLKKGKAFMRDGSRVNQAFDFSEKNYFPLRTQHELMKRLFFPDNYSEDQRFKLSEADMEALKKYMYKVPRTWEDYDEAEYYDSYVKFFIYGDTKERIPEQIKIYNKVGYAYGTLTETAYITDEKEGISFLVSATILVNSNGVFNDDTYEYDDIGIPFLAQLGRELYTQEFARKKSK